MYWKMYMWELDQTALPASWEICMQVKKQQFLTCIQANVHVRCESWTIKKAKAEELMLFNYGAREDSWESLV